MGNTPELSEILRSAFTTLFANLRTCMPGRVESYDATTQKANVKPLIKQAVINEEGERVVESLPVIPAVPVCFQGGGGYRTTYPIEAGDLVLLVFADCSLDKWLARGGEVDPQDDRRNHLSDAFAIPGVFDFASAPVASDDSMIVGKTGNTERQIKINDDEINIAAGANGAAREGDTVIVSIPGGYTDGMGATHPFTTTLTGTITGSSSRVKIG